MILLASAPVAFAGAIVWDDIAGLRGADIVVFGEIHDNPLHHLRQADLLGHGHAGAGSPFSPAAVVYEMLTPGQASRLTPDQPTDAESLQATLGWNASGWPDFSLYYPIFAASRHLPVYGAAVPRAAARAALQDGLLQAFGADAAQFGLTRPLSADQQTAREILQREAHCNALPDDMLPGMVDIQRLRDARLAKVALQALDDTGGPVVVITGNGHARKDWGVPAVLAQARPGIAVFSILQGEDDQAPDGTADLILRDAPAVDRPDPCLAFTK